jgi:chitinase
MHVSAQRVLTLLIGTLLANPITALRNNIKPCPEACSQSNDPHDWIDYHSLDRLGQCKEPMLLDFSLFTPLNQTDTDFKFLTCTPESVENGEDADQKRRSTSDFEYQEAKFPLQLVKWGGPEITGDNNESIKNLIGNVQSWLGKSSPEDQFHIFGKSGDTVIGMYIGLQLERSSAVQSITEQMLGHLDENGTPLMALQRCGPLAANSMGLAISTDGDLNSVQRLIRQWISGDCPSDFDDVTEVSETSFSMAPATAMTTSLHRRGPAVWSRADNCDYKQVEDGDSCGSLAEKCGISGDDFTKYNDDKDLCSTLTPGQYVCCSEGELPDFSPDPSENGTCYTHLVESKDSCSTLAASHSITVDDIESFNEHT